MKKYIPILAIASAILIIVGCVFYQHVKPDDLEYGMAVGGINGNYNAKIKLDNTSWDKIDEQQKEEFITESIDSVESKIKENEDFILTGFANLSEDTGGEISKVFEYDSKKNALHLYGEKEEVISPYW